LSTGLSIQDASKKRTLVLLIFHREVTGIDSVIDCQRYEMSLFTLTTGNIRSNNLRQNDPEPHRIDAAFAKEVLHVESKTWEESRKDSSVWCRREGEQSVMREKWYEGMIAMIC
jgi:hypothetical protein